jgi:predicted Holliday junction resolvase-like endonuclease
MTEYLPFIVVALIVLLMVLFLQNRSLKRGISQIQNQIDQRAQERYLSWCDSDREVIRVQLSEVIQQEFTVKFDRWKSEFEGVTRSDAIQRSQSVIIGNVTQHIAPYLPDFEYNPNDVRFIGHPVDLIIFNGMSEGSLQSIVFAEVKTGRSAKLEPRQRQIRDIIKAGKIEWDVIKVKREV